MPKYILVVFLLLGLSSCHSKNEKTSLIEEQIIGTWLSSECQPKDNFKSIKQEYTFSDDTVVETMNNYWDANCNNLLYSENLAIPLTKNGIIKSDTGENMLHLKWESYYESGEVKETHLSVYVEGSSLYFGNIDLDDNNTPSTIRFDEPFYKVED